LAAAVLVTADPTGLESGEHLGSILIELDDDWLTSASVVNVSFWVYAAGMEILSTGHFAPWDMATDIPGDGGEPAPVIATLGDDDGSLIPISPEGALGSPLATGLNPFPGGLATGADGNWYVGTQTGDGNILEVTREGAASLFVTMPGGANPFWLATGPEGELYASLCELDAVYRIASDGSSIGQFGPSVPCASGVAYSPAENSLYVGAFDGGGLRRIPLDGGSSVAVALEVESPLAVTVGRSGKVYITDNAAGLWLMDPEAGTSAEFVGLVPELVLVGGVDLAEGALLLSGMDGFTGAGEFYRFPVDDGPTPTGVGPITASLGEFEGLLGEPFQVPLTLDLTRTVEKAAGYSARIEWDPALMGFEAIDVGDFGGTFSSDVGQSGDGIIDASSVRADGLGFGVYTLFNLSLDMDASVGPGDQIGLDFSFDVLGGPEDEDLLSSLTIEPRSICVSDWVWGDVTRDGSLGSGDAVQILRFVIGMSLAAGADIALGDVNGDGVVNAMDAVQILRYLVELPLPPDRRVDRYGISLCPV
jgi:streptogramin lyase